MGISNLKQSLQAKMGLWAGELADKEAREAEILSLFEQLPTVQKRAHDLREVLRCAERVMLEIDPTWTKDKVKPSKPFVHKSAVRIGNTAKFALDVLREAEKPLTAREIAMAVLELDEVDASTLTPEEINKVVNAVNSTLVQKLGELTAHDGQKFARRWRIEVPPLRAVG